MYSVHVIFKHRARMFVNVYIQVVVLPFIAVMSELTLRSTPAPSVPSRILLGTRRKRPQSTRSAILDTTANYYGRWVIKTTQ